MSKLIDLTGRRFGRLLVLQREGVYISEEGIHTTPTWRCRCDCGREIVVVGASLRIGRTRSCGCLHRDLTIERNRKRKEARACDTI